MDATAASAAANRAPLPVYTLRNILFILRGGREC